MLLSSQVLIHTGHVQAKPSHLSHKELEGSIRLLGILGIQAPGGGVEVHGGGLRRKAGAGDGLLRAEAKLGVVGGCVQVGRRGPSPMADGRGG